MSIESIDIDFDVFKKLTAMRESESVSYNDVLRELLGLNSSMKPSSATEGVASSGAWTTKGVTFPAGTEFRASHKGQTVTGRVDAGALVVNGKRFDSPSAAAGAITCNSVNGWIFWECKLPGRSSWQVIKSLRK